MIYNVHMKWMNEYSILLRNMPLYYDSFIMLNQTIVYDHTSHLDPVLGEQSSMIFMLF